MDLQWSGREVLPRFNDIRQPNLLLMHLSSVTFVSLSDSGASLDASGILKSNFYLPRAVLHNFAHAYRWSASISVIITITQFIESAVDLINSQHGNSQWATSRWDFGIKILALAMIAQLMQFQYSRVAGANFRSVPCGGQMRICSHLIYNWINNQCNCRYDFHSSIMQSLQLPLSSSFCARPTTGAQSVAERQQLIYYASAKHTRWPDWPGPGRRTLGAGGPFDGPLIIYLLLIYGQIGINTLPRVSVALPNYVTLC